MSTFDVSQFLEANMIKNCHYPIPGSWVIDGVRVNICINWLKDNKDNHTSTRYIIKAYVNGVSVGMAYGCMNDNNSALERLLRYKWHNRGLHPPQYVDLWNGVASVIYASNTQPESDVCYVCHEQVTDNTKTDCDHTICTPCYYKSVRQNVDGEPYLECGICRRKSNCIDPE